MPHFRRLARGTPGHPGSGGGRLQRTTEKVRGWPSIWISDCGRTRGDPPSTARSIAYSIDDSRAWRSITPLLRGRQAISQAKQSHLLLLNFSLSTKRGHNLPVRPTIGILDSTSHPVDSSIGVINLDSLIGGGQPASVSISLPIDEQTPATGDLGLTESGLRSLARVAQRRLPTDWAHHARAQNGCSAARADWPAA